MKTGCLMSLMGVIVGVVIATMIYGHQARKEQRQQGINQLMLKGMNAAEAAGTFDREYRIEVNYESVNYYPWVIGGGLFGSAGGFMVGAVIECIRDSRAKKQTIVQPPKEESH